MEIILIVIIVVGFLLLILFFQSQFKNLKQAQKENGDQKLMLQIVNDLRKEVQSSSGKNREEIQGRLDAMMSQLNRGLNHSSQTLERQFVESRSLIKEATEKIAQFEETNKKIVGFAGQLQSLENILKNPKHRGVLGEYYLETMLKSVFEPGQYQMQYKFNDGAVVDAVIFYQKKILPIDSKFSMENYNKMVQETDAQRRSQMAKELASDIKKRINETAKYIRPKEDTFDFAFMFIPSEGLYYDMLVAEVGALRETSVNLIEYSWEKKVIPVSPSSFHAYLQTILHGLRSVEMQESMTHIVKRVGQLDKHLKAYETHFNKLGVHLGTTVNTYNKSSKEFAKIDKDVYKISEGEAGGNLELLEISKPEVDE